MKLTLPYPPQANHLYAIVRGRKILSAKGRAYKYEVGLGCVSEGLRPTAEMVGVTLTVYRPRKAGDLDNTIKVVLDSVKGFLWHDDKQVIEIHAFRRDDKLNPRIEIEVQEI